MVTRNSYWSMMKDGPYRAFRNLPVGWVLQVIHSTDTTERLVRIFTEMAVIALFWHLSGGISFSVDGFVRLAWVFLLVHSLSWYFLGNFWVYMLDSFTWVKNPGITGVLEYVEFVRRVYAGTSNCRAILIYGSMCRNAFHVRSDLDLRVVRSEGLLSGLWDVFLGFFVRIPAAIKGIPVDLQVVDSQEFLYKQMRDDEHPIVVFRSSESDLKNPGLSFETVLDDPAQVLKDKNSFKAIAN